ncbi:MAG: hypothetical protein KFH87_03925 [Bacteroidetes bacterium]|nr:hypothetical protein [Bacteroidota bacterium]
MQRKNIRLPMLLLFSVIMLISVIPASAQDDELRELSDLQFVDYLRQYRDPAVHAVLPGGERAQRTEKCGFAVMVEAARRLEHAAPPIASDIRAMLAPQRRQTSLFSPSGLFRIHYDTSGAHAAALLDDRNVRIPNSAHDYAQKAAEVFDHVYQVEIGEYGFDPPPFEELLSYYNIFVLDFRGSVYGQTLFNLPLPSSGTVRPTYASFVEIDNDFLGYETQGLDGLRVTAAHEFHHVVQLGTYGLWLNDRWMHEMASTYFEEAVYPEVNDYFQYIRTYMRNTERPMWRWGVDGYELALWPLFLESKYDQTLMRDFWTGMRQSEPVSAMRDGISAHGGDMTSELCSWAQANFFTGYRAPMLLPAVYDDAPGLALPQLHAGQELLGNTATINGSVAPTGAMYMRVYRGLDTVSFVVANTDIAAAAGRDVNGVAFELEVRAEDWTAATHTALGNGWAYRLTAAASNVLCLGVPEGGASNLVERELPFPNPYDPGEFSRMYFPLPRTLDVNQADLYVFSPSMNLIARREAVSIELDDNFGAYVGFDGKTDDGAMLASGIYFYVVRFGDESRSGKFAVVRR